jgi:hypothetical protein
MSTVDSFAVTLTVRCLACGTPYAKPNGHGTVRGNPGCPRCGYVGWAAAEPGVTPQRARARFSADPLHALRALAR